MLLVAVSNTLKLCQTSGSEAAVLWEQQGIPAHTGKCRRPGSYGWVPLKTHEKKRILNPMAQTKFSSELLTQVYAKN